MQKRHTDLQGGPEMSGASDGSVVRGFGAGAWAVARGPGEAAARAAAAAMGRAIQVATGSRGEFGLVLAGWVAVKDGAMKDGAASERGK